MLIFQSLEFHSHPILKKSSTKILQLEILIKDNPNECKDANGNTSIAFPRSI